MHKKSNLLSLEQRRTFQLLNLMYLHKQDVNNLRIPPRQGVELWKLLPQDIATSDSIHQFKKLLKSRYKDFVDTTA